MRSMRVRGRDIVPPFIVRWICSPATSYFSILEVRPSTKTAMPALAWVAKVRTAMAARVRIGRRYNGTGRTIMPQPWSRPRMELLVHFLQTSPRHMRVDLRRRDIRVPEHHLHAAQIGAVLEQMRGE